MSGAEVIGLIAGIIGIIDAVIKVYDAAKDASPVPSSFREISLQLPAIQETLAVAMSGVAKDDPASPSGNALKSMLEGCRNKAADLEAIFTSVLRRADTSVLDRYRLSVKQLSKAEKAQTLRDSILSDLQVLTANHMLRVTTRDEIKKLMESVKQSGFGGTTAKYGPYMEFNNPGPGLQIVHSQSGDVNINSGKGTQFNGPVSGSFYFGSSSNQGGPANKN